MADTVLEGMLSLDAAEKTIVVPGVADVWASMQRFKWPDYVMFSLMLMICIIIGIYFGIYKVSTNTQEYLMGSRKIPFFPASMSILASYVSGISLLGMPTEFYLYGIQFMYILFGSVMMAFMVNYIYLPVFYNLKLTSIHEYLETRFNKSVRIFGSVLFIINLITWLPIVIYVPALAFNQVTGFDIHIITPIICLICIFYTSLGGIKAVIWTDVIQALIMFGAMLVIIIKGTIDVGGLGEVFSRNWNSGRIEPPNLDLNPLSRHTIWSLAIGGSIWLLQSAAINQTMMQRILSLPSLNLSKWSVWMFVLGQFCIVFVCGYSGILMYASFHKCDPLTTTLAREKDQLLTLFVMDVLGDYPGLPGIFVAGVLSAALSSLSTGLNSMAAVVLEDFYRNCFSTEITEKHASIVMKLTVVLMGIACVGLVYVIQHLGAVLQLTMSVGSIASGPSLGLFTMGMLLPWVNSKGVLAGGITSLVSMSWLCLQAQAAIATGDLSFPEKPLSADGCDYHFTPKQSLAVNIHFHTEAHNATEFLAPSETFVVHHLSYLWYTLVGLIISIVVGLIVSFLTKPVDPRDVEPTLLADFVRKLIKPREFPNEPGDGIIFAFDRNVPMKKIEEPE